MTRNEVSILISGNSRGLTKEIGSSRTVITRFTQGARQEFEDLKRSMSGLQGTLAGLGISIGIVKQMMDSARLDKSLMQIGQTAGATSQIKNLRGELFSMARQTGRSVEELQDGFNSLVQSGLNMGEAKATLEGINVAMAVTGAKAETLASGLTVAGAAFGFDLSKPGKALELLDRMTVAGRLGNAELQNLASIFGRVGVNAADAGLSFDKTLGFIEALSQVEKQPERLSTLTDSTLRVFTNLQYMAAAQKSTGVKFFGKGGERRDPLEVVKEMKAAYDKLKTDKERSVFIQRSFGETDLDTQKGMKMLLQGDTLTKVREFSTLIGQAGGTLKKDLGEATGNLVDQAGRLKETLKQAADDFVKPINETLSMVIQRGLDKKENGGLELSGKDMILGGAGLGLGTLLLSRYGSKGLAGLAGKFLKGGGSLAVGVAEGKALQAAVGVTPVFVTNWPGDLKAGTETGNTPGALGDIFNPGGAGSKTRNAFSWAKRIWDIANNPVAKGTSYLPWLASRAGLVGLAGLGGYGIGTGINSFINWSTTYQSGGKYDTFAEKLYDVLHPENGNGGGAPVKNDIVINMRIDGKGQTFIENTGMNTQTRINLKRGVFDGVLMSPGY